VGEPDQLPGFAVSAWPACAAPLMVGGLLLTGTPAVVGM